MVLAAGLLGVFPGRADAQALEVFTLRYRTVQEMVPVIQPILVPGGTVSGLKGQLVVRTTPANMDEVRRILAKLDTRPRRLLITVRQDGHAYSHERSAIVTARAGSGGSRTAGTPGADMREPDVRVTARVLDSSAADSDRNVHTVQVMEGSPAYIRVGQDVPVPPRRFMPAYPGGPLVDDAYAGIEYREVSSGFYALPRVTGDRVVLEISPHREALSGQVRGGVNVQYAATTVEGRLGDWIEVAGSSNAAMGSRTVILGATSATGADTRRVLVKVEELR